MRSKLFGRKHEASRELILKKKRGQFAFLICIGLTAIVAFSMMDLQLASAFPNETRYCDTEAMMKLPIASTNWTETQYCDVEDCHENDEPTTWIDVTETGQTTGEISYDVTGSDNYPGSEGWGVFDPLMNNVANGELSGSFTLPKSQWTYRVFWVDNETDGTLGSAYEDITVPGSDPHDLVLTGDTQVEAGTSHSYTFSAVDDEEQDIFHMIEWGDGSDTDWLGPYESGEEDSKSHSWSEEGTYTIKLTSRDPYDGESTKTLKVEVPKIKAYTFNSFFLKFLEQHPFLFPILRMILG